MTALAEALLAAQRQAISALSKAYVADAFDPDLAPATYLTETLNSLGCTDVVEQGHLLASLDVLRTFGAASPAPTGQANESRKAPEQPTGAQMTYIGRLCRENNVPAPDHVATKEQASEIIEALKAGTYNADAYTVPF